MLFDQIDDPDGVPSYFGFASSIAGDVDGDGSLDVAVGAERYSNGLGLAYVFRSLGGAIQHTPHARLTNPGSTTTGDFGVSVSGGGDVNGDGYSDVLIGAHTENRAFLFTGSAQGISPTRYVTLGDSSSTGSFGLAVRIVGDIQADGFGDLAISSPSASLVQIFAGGAAGPTTTSILDLDSPDAGYFGSSLALYHPPPAPLARRPHAASPARLRSYRHLAPTRASL